MDTFAETTVITKKAETGREANDKIKEICEEIENRISNKIEQSEIYEINRKLSSFPEEYNYQLSENTSRLWETIMNMQEITEGAFNPFLGEIIDLWNISNPDESELPEKADFYPALERLKNFTYTVHYGDPPDSAILIEGEKPLPKIDLGAIGKGYAIDEISCYLAETGIPNALISFSSSVLAAGKNKSGNLWTVGIKNPLNAEKICGYIGASDKVIAVSGGYERFITVGGIDYCHIIDPETGYPVDNDLLCVVVVMDAQSALQSKDSRERLKNNGAIADALSTALYVMGKEKALKFYNSSSLDFEMILFVKKDTADKSKGYDIIPTNLIFTEINDY